MKNSIVTFNTISNQQSDLLIKNAIEKGLKHPEKVLKSNWKSGRKEVLPNLKNASFLSAFTAMFICCPLEIREVHFQIMRSYFSQNEIDQICILLSKKLHSKLPKAG
ncbi:MAG: hypothetical protein ACXIUQ_12675 [Cecembia sp.]